MRSESLYGCWLVRHVAACVTVCARSALPRCLCAKERSAFVHTENLVSGLFEKVFFFLSYFRKQKGWKKIFSIATEQTSTNKKEPQLFKKKTQERLSSKNLETSLRKSPDSCVFWVYALRACVCVSRVLLLVYNQLLGGGQTWGKVLMTTRHAALDQNRRRRLWQLAPVHNHPASRRLSEVTIVCFSSRHVFMTVAQERK